MFSFPTTRHVMAWYIVQTFQGELKIKAGIWQVNSNGAVMARHGCVHSCVLEGAENCRRGVEYKIPE